jgi:hypothetical protein
MSNTSLFSIAYPSYANVIRGVEQLPLSTRGLLIKVCQAQSIPSDESSALAQLIDNHPPLLLRLGNYFERISLRAFLENYNINPYDPPRKRHSTRYLSCCLNIS